MSETQEGLIRSLLSVVYQDMRAAAEMDLQTILEMERGKCIPKGYAVLPESATMSMHNAAALGGIYVNPSIEVATDGKLVLRAWCPDWISVYRVMVDAAPRRTNSTTEGK